MKNYRIDFKDSSFNEDTGHSHVIVSLMNNKNHIKDFSGDAYVHPKDNDFASTFSGCRIAEGRATIIALNFIYKTEREKYIEVRNYYNDLNNYKKVQENLDIQEILFKQLQIRKDALQEVKDNLERAGEHLRTEISTLKKHIKKRRNEYYFKNKQNK